ncbi:hypothetical protein BT96DRAFT_113893 [Gymnopus androsaceus JB14]|uniref:Uncharacterized protein n=1 Tax=Gymnopus androsaceus JB14 TaxID=1447944 RepID=A0A6A4HDI3_9AGAR|nr:hypothetical protein BT96DRAFT_113893 [Gymnopus androsaceus JB14]
MFETFPLPETALSSLFGRIKNISTQAQLPRDQLYPPTHPPRIHITSMDSFNSLDAIFPAATSALEGTPIFTPSRNASESPSTLPFDFEHSDDSDSVADTGFCVIA